MSEQHPNPGRWWRHRRAGFYTGIVWSIVQTFLWAGLALWKTDAVSSLGVVIGWSYGIPATLIIGYYGNTAVEELAKKGGAVK
jgi:hypothetical protein